MKIEHQHGAWRAVSIWAYVISMLSYLLLERLLGTVQSRTFPYFSISTYQIHSGRRSIREEWRPLDGSARNEEPLVVNSVNGLGSQVLMPRDFEGASIYTVWRVRDGPIGPIAKLS